MKKITFCIMATCLLLASNPIQSKAEKTSEPTTLVASKPTETAENKTLLLRLDEINAMDKSDLKSQEKRALRKEVRTIKHQLSEGGGGIYISAGAIIIIVLLLIILL